MFEDVEHGAVRVADEEAPHSPGLDRQQVDELQAGGQFAVEPSRRRTDDTCTLRTIRRTATLAMLRLPCRRVEPARAVGTAGRVAGTPGLMGCLKNLPCVLSLQLVAALRWSVGCCCSDAGSDARASSLLIVFTVITRRAPPPQPAREPRCEQRPSEHCHPYAGQPAYGRHRFLVCIQAAFRSAEVTMATSR